jgi:hypothetical protein
MGKYRFFLLGFLFLLCAQQAAAQKQTKTATFANGQAIFSFSNNVTFKVLGPQCVDGTTATVTLRYVSPKTLNNLVPGFSCIKRKGTNKCLEFDWANTVFCPDYEVRIFYLTDDPLGVNPRLCVCHDETCEPPPGEEVCDVDGYVPAAPTDIGADPAFVRGTSENSIFFAATEALDPGARGVAAILEPLAGHTSELNPLVVSGGSSIPLKVLLCRTTLNPCDFPIPDAQILVSIAQIKNGSGNDTFKIVFPPDFPGSSTPPPTMEFVGNSHYQFNWTTPTIPGLYNVSFIFLTSNHNVLTAFVEVQ